MNDLIAIHEMEISGETIPSCDARELHAALGSLRDFPTWMRSRIEDAQLVEHRDYEVFHGSGENSVGRPRKDYALSLDAAKHIALMERTSKGRQIREYFIEAEKRFRAKQTAAIVPVSPAEVLLQMAQSLVEQERRQREIEDRVRRIESRQEAAEKGTAYFSIVAYVRYRNMGPLDLGTAQRIGRRAAERCRAEGYVIGTLTDPRFGLINSYPEHVLDDVFAADEN